jgi:hypothetical protein
MNDYGRDEVSKAFENFPLNESIIPVGRGFHRHVMHPPDNNELGNVEYDDCKCDHKNKAGIVGNDFGGVLGNACVNQPISKVSGDRFENIFIYIYIFYHDEITTS